jgi:HD-GYP domain-containing protein (c-di-GMP phosphodiesterase class II)
MGIIYIEIDYHVDNIKLLEIFSKQASAALSNVALNSLLNIKNEQLQESNTKLNSYYLDTIEALRLTVDAKDFYTRGHSDRVAFYSTKIGEALSLSSKELENLRIGRFVSRYWKNWNFRRYII